MAKQYQDLASVPGIYSQQDRPITPADPRHFRELPATTATDSSWHDLMGEPIISSPLLTNTVEARPCETGQDAHARLLRERLAAPGTVSDYVLAIAAYLEALWVARREMPEALEEMEHNFRLGLTLIELHADELSKWGHDGSPRPLIWPFRQMCLVYEREGYLHEALDVAERAARLNTWFTATSSHTRQAGDVENIRARIALIAGESHVR